MKPAQSHFGPKVTLYYKTASGKQRWIDAQKIYDTTPWTDVKVRTEIPQDTVALQVLIGIQRADGTFWVDNLELNVVKP